MHYIFTLFSLLFLLAGSCLQGATITVTSNADSGANTLRAALASAASGDTIDFAIPPTGSVATINLLTVLNVNTPVIIKGSTQLSPTATTPGIQLSGGGTSSFAGLAINVSNCNVSGLIVNKCTQGIVIFAASSTGISDCYIGTDVTGTVASPNGTGIVLSASVGTFSGTGINGCCISGNNSGAIIQTGNFTGTTLVSNKIGVNIAGNPLPNGSDAVQLAGTNNIVLTNTISHNSGNGIVIDGGSGNIIDDNMIQNNGQAGILLQNLTSNNTIGSSSNGNTITNNGRSGIAIAAGNNIENDIQYNSIYNNTLLGIDLGNTGTPLANNATNPVTNNPNEYQNYPVLSSAFLSCQLGILTISITGSLYPTGNSTGLPNATYTLNFFENSANRNPNITEGQTFIGTTTITTNASGNYGTFAAAFGSPSNVVNNRWVSATATSPTGDTSEFSLNEAVTSNISISGTTTYCSGQTVTLTANASGATSYSWQTPARGTISGNPLTFTNAQTTDSGTYTLTVTYTSGCTIVVTTAITVLQSPTVTASGGGTFCSGTNFTLTATATGAISYSWHTPTRGTIGGNPLTLTDVQTTDTGAYTVTVTASNGCTAAATTNVTIDQSPTVTVSGGGTFCSGNNFTLTANGSGAASYSWLTPHRGTIGGNPLIITNPQTTDSGTYTVTATASNGCTAAASTNVTVNQTPSVSISGGGTFCSGNDFTLTANSPGAVSYMWSTPSRGPFTGNPLTITDAQTTDTGSYTVTVVNSDGCPNSTNTFVTINQSPSVSISGQTTYCVGQTIDLLANTTAATIVWQTPARGTIAANPLLLSDAQTTDSGTYTVTVTDENGCSSSTSILVTVTASSIITISGATSYCVGDTIMLQAQGVPMGATVEWQTPDRGMISGAVLVLTDAQLADTGLYIVTVNSNGCISTAQVEVTVTECVVLTITKKCCPDNPEPGDRVRFKISVMNSGAVPAYNVMVTDILPSCVSFKGTNKNNGWTITVDGQDVTAQIPLIGAGQTSSFTICGTLGCCFCNQLFNIASVTAESITQPGVAACSLKPRKIQGLNTLLSVD